jgi:hypothetical protein
VLPCATSVYAHPRPPLLGDTPLRLDLGMVLSNLAQVFQGCMCMDDACEWTKIWMHEWCMCIDA